MGKRARENWVDILLALTVIAMAAALIVGCATTGDVSPLDDGSTIIANYNNDVTLAATVESIEAFALGVLLSDTDDEILAIKDGVEVANEYLVSVPIFQALDLDFYDLLSMRGDEVIPGLSDVMRRQLMLVEILRDRDAQAYHSTLVRVAAAGGVYNLD